LRILKEINEPFDFAGEEDMLTESKEQKAERWQIANIQIFTELYRKGAYKEDLMRKILKTLLDKALLKNVMALKLITELLKRIAKNYDRKRRDKDLNEIISQIQGLGKDKSYPGPIRFPLLNAVKEFDDLTL
jgi:hypothetical protein